MAHEHVVPYVTGTGAVVIAIVMALRRPLAARKEADREAAAEVWEPR
jgi:hypothetical protein